MDEAEGFGLNDLRHQEYGIQEAQQDVVRTPLSMSAVDGTSLSPEEKEMKQVRSAPPPGGALANPSGKSPQPSGVERAMGVLRLALPFVQRILPVLDGNFGTAVSNILAPQPHPQQQPAPPPVNLKPIENGLAELQTQQRDLRTQMAEQNASLKRVEDRLEMVREATDRNTLEQQELLEDLKAVGSKIKIITVIALILLAGSIGLNVFFLLHIERILP